MTEATPIIPPDEDLGQLTNGSTQITPDTALTLSSSSYNVAIILDMSASMFTVVSAHFFLLLVFPFFTFVQFSKS